MSDATAEQVVISEGCRWVSAPAEDESWQAAEIERGLGFAGEVR